MALFYNIRRWYENAKEKREAHRILKPHMPLLQSLRKPALIIEDAKNKNTASKFWGVPNLPDNLKWPTNEGKPLTFVCQISLSELPESQYSELLPAVGTIFFFYDFNNEYTGYDPKHKDGWRFLFSSINTKETPERKQPRKPERDDKDRPWFLEVIETRIKFKELTTYPDISHPEIIEINLSEEFNWAYAWLTVTTCKSSYDRLFGHTAQEQFYRMEERCDEIYNKLYGHQHSQNKDIYTLMDEWILLMQLDGYSYAEWFANGTLFAWIKKDDLLDLNFDRCWIEIQFT